MPRRAFPQKRISMRWPVALGLSAVVAAGVVVVSMRTEAASRSISGWGIVQAGVTSDRVPILFTKTTPYDAKLDGATGRLESADQAKVHQYVGQTAVGGAQKAATRKRITVRTLTEGEEVSFKGAYSPGDPLSVKPTSIFLHDRSFTVCGKFQGITQRTAAGSGENEFTLQMSKITVQEERNARFFPLNKDVKFMYGDSTKFHLANGSWKAPKNRVAKQPVDLTTNRDYTVVKGKITGKNKLEATDVDLGIKCS